MNSDPPKMVVVVDAGNTRVKLGRFDLADPDTGELPRADYAAAVPCGTVLPWTELDAERHFSIVTGSNPDEAARVVHEWPKEWSPPQSLENHTRLPLVINVDFPERVGIDRLLTAIAANVIRQPEQPAIILDSGTATTVNYVDAAGAFCGGAILPGFELCAKALHEYTALLPMIEMAAVMEDESPPAEIGRNTQAAITSGLYWGHVGAVKELMRRLMLAGGSHDEPLILLTGGAAPLLFPHLPTIVRHEPHLALQGLAIAARAMEHR